jgi:hypothetical protein
VRESQTFADSGLCIQSPSIILSGTYPRFSKSVIRKRIARGIDCMRLFFFLMIGWESNLPADTSMGRDDDEVVRWWVARD